MRDPEGEGAAEARLERDAEVRRWNETLASGTPDQIERVRSEVLDSIHARVMDDDYNYVVAGWTPRL